MPPSMPWCFPRSSNETKSEMMIKMQDMMPPPPNIAARGHGAYEICAMFLKHEAWEEALQDKKFLTKMVRPSMTANDVAKLRESLRG
ncbi:hypothetical protein HDU90_007589 [Geranomyces variabilis]|nr:hypothetical protein HDU90_007589 [Geranomyces variabilis]